MPCLDNELSGASHANVGADAAVTVVVATGASELEASGVCGDVVVTASGASEIDLAACSAGDADVSLSGASRGWVTMDGRLDVDLSGASSLYYRGTVVFGVLDVSAGSILAAF